MFNRTTKVKTRDHIHVDLVFWSANSTFFTKNLKTASLISQLISNKKYNRITNCYFMADLEKSWFLLNSCMR